MIQVIKKLKAMHVLDFVACVTGHHFITAECFFYCFPEHGICSTQKACICWDIPQKLLCSGEDKWNMIRLSKDKDPPFLQYVAHRFYPIVVHVTLHFDTTMLIWLLHSVI
jgi:hypothetical protein